MLFLGVNLLSREGNSQTGIPTGNGFTAQRLLPWESIAAFPGPPISSVYLLVFFLDFSCEREIYGKENRNINSQLCPYFPGTPVTPAAIKIHIAAGKIVTGSGKQLQIQEQGNYGWIWR
jgi:hypothetical protein